MSSQQDFENFAKKYPDLMSKSQQDYIGVGKGWHHILDMLFCFLSADLERAKTRLKYAMDNPNANMGEGVTIATLEAKVKEEYDKLPTIQQIKEKFGGLRFYVDHSTHDQELAIGFVEAMSTRVCEVCGSPGTRRAGGWIKTLCDKHHQESIDGTDVLWQPDTDDN